MNNHPCTTPTKEDPARAALARLVAAIREHVDTRETMRWQPKFPPDEYEAAAAAELAAINELNAAFAEAERALEEPERDWKAEARDDWSERALEDAR